MAFTFSIIEWSSVIDPTGLFRQTGTSEGDVGSGGIPGSTRVSFSAAATRTITTGSDSGAADFPDDGGARLYAPVTLNGTSFATGARVEADFEVILHDPASGHYFRATWLAIDNQPVGVSLSRAWDAAAGRYVDGPGGIYDPGQSLVLIDGDTLDGSPNIAQFATDSNYASDGIGNDAVLNDSNGSVTCFLRGTEIMTPQGERRVEDLRVGDLVATRDHGLQKLRWIGNRRIMARELSARPELRAIRISAGSLGRGLPKSDLLVSPQHRILVRSLIAQRMFGTPEVLVAAKQLLELDGIERAEDLDEIEYFHLLFDRHEIVYSNGAETESLYTGAEALRGVGMAARDEIFALFPELRRDGSQPASARPLVPGSQGRTLAARHLRNGKSLQH